MTKNTKYLIVAGAIGCAWWYAYRGWKVLGGGLEEEKRQIEILAAYQSGKITVDEFMAQLKCKGKIAQ